MKLIKINLFAIITQSVHTSSAEAIEQDCRIMVSRRTKPQDLRFFRFDIRNSYGDFRVRMIR